ATPGVVDRLKQGDLGEHDVGFEGVQAHEGADAGGELGRLAGEAFDDARQDAVDGPHALGDVVRHRDLVAVDLAAVFGDGLDPGGVDLGGVNRGIACGAFVSTRGEDFLGEHIGGGLAQKLDVAFE